MAGLTKEQRALKAAALAAGAGPDSPPEVHADAPALVCMTKGGIAIDVHPTCVDEHKRLGWTLAG
jgi:hypothetical protein